MSKTNRSVVDAAEQRMEDKRRATELIAREKPIAGSTTSLLHPTKPAPKTGRPRVPERLRSPLYE
jgi:hypothetical protein